MQHSPTPNANAPRRILPSDCLHHVIGQFKSDRKQLHSLLFVNKFFFNAAVRHLYQNHALHTLDYDYGFPKLLSTIFVSFLQTAVKESIDVPDNNKTASKIASEILGNFGLELALPYQPSGITLLHQIYDSRNKHPPIECDPNAFSTMTIDYSRLVTELDIAHIRFDSIFNLKSSTKDDDDIPKSDLWFRPLEASYANHRSVLATHSFYLMWIHHNCSTITKFRFIIEIAQVLLPYAAKLSKLEAISIGKQYNAIGESDFEATLLFIRQNQSAFPKKRPLRILDWDTLRSESNNIQYSINPTSYSSYISSMRQIRSTLIQQSKPKIAVFEAVRRPIAMNVTFIPNFYNLSQNIELDCLLEFSDFDNARYDMGEMESMERFLQRSSNLKSLEVVISHENAFSWATLGQQSTLKAPLMKLEELTIVYTSVYQYALMGLRDSLLIFPSLRKVVLSMRSHGRTSMLAEAVYKRNFDTLRSIQLSHVPEANIIGDLPVIIPNLTQLDLNLDNNFSVNIGSLDKFPNLEDLHIDFSYGFSRIIRPPGEEPTSIPVDNTLLDNRWRNTNIDYKLFPIWNLPKLRYLKLGSLAAIKFDFATLPLLHRLETLEISTKFQESEGYAESYFRLQNKTPPESEFISNEPHGPRNGVFGTHSNRKWTLPYLRSIKIKGLPAQVLCLENLRSFPGLRSIDLDHPLTAEANYRPRVYRFPISDRLPDLDSNQVFLESQLEILRISGDFCITSEDLTSLLTIYAPFLKTFRAFNLRLYEYLQPPPCVRPAETEIFNILKAIKVADNLNTINSSVISPSEVDEEKKLPGRQLGFVNIGGIITDKELQDLGLIKIEAKDFVLYSKRRVRITRLGITENVVRIIDYEVIEKEKKIKL